MLPGSPQQAVTKAQSTAASNINNMAKQTEAWLSVDQQPASEVW